MGDGNSGCPSFVHLYGALAKGTVADIEAAIQKDLHPPKRSWLARLIHPSPKQAPISQSEAVIRLLEGPCRQEEKPLDYAVVAGNVEATKYLLEHGADPSAFNGSNTLYSRCETFLYSGSKLAMPIDGPKRLKAYELTIAFGGDVNRTDYLGRNALNLCYSIDFLQFLVEHGAVVRQGHIDQAFADALGTEPGGYTARRLNALARIRFFLDKGVRPSETIRERLALDSCGHSTLPTFAAICPELRQLLQEAK